MSRRRSLANAALAALIAAIVMIVALRGISPGLAILGGPALAGAITAYLVPRIRAIDVWLGQTALGAGVAIVVAFRDHTSASGVLIGFAIIAVLGMGAAAAVHAARPVRAPTVRLPAARLVRH